MPLSSALVRQLTFSSIALLVVSHIGAQQSPPPTRPDSAGKAQVIAGPQYKAGGFKRTFMGRHYRPDWTQPTRVPVFRMDTLGGLTVTETGGGKQTFSLRLKDANGRQYALRTVDKDNSTVLPEILRGTFIDRIAQDLVSSAHPYAAVTIPLMAQAAGVYHTRPQVVLVPDDPRFGENRERVANRLFLFEERPDDMPVGIPNFGNATEIIGSDKLKEHLATKPNHRVDQEAYVRARLFDMFIGDWDRHEDQWRWARFKEGDRTLYRPIPRDRDQAYALFQGVIPYLLTLPEELEVLESFRGDIKNLKKFNNAARFLDRQLANEVPQERWIAIAQDMQTRLTDAVIEQSVRQLPPEIFALSGETIIQKLKSRRGHLSEYAQHFGRYLSETVEVVGTLRSDRFVVQPAAGSGMHVQVFSGNSTQPYYQRTFDPQVTDEVRLYGLGGADIFHVEGERHIKLRLIGSPGKDSMLVSGSGKKAFIYNNTGDAISESGPVKVQLSNDSAVTSYDYRGFKPNTGHAIKFPGFSNTRGIHFNLGYIYRKYGFRKEPFSWEQRLRANYSIFNNSFGGDYYGIFHHAVGKASLLLDARFDQALRHLYFGIGNETKVTLDRTLYRLMTSELVASAGLQWPIGKHHRPGFTIGYEGTKVLREENEKYFAGSALSGQDPSTFLWKQFGSAALYYNYHSVDNEGIPTKGFNLNLSARHVQNLTESDRKFQQYDGSFTAYIPFTRVISVALRAGASRVDGDAEFYQLPTLGGGNSLRGYRRERFRGETVAYNQNELRFLWDFRSILFNGKLGLVGFYDQGRVWHPIDRGDGLDTWHTGFGAGIMIVPFNMVAITVAYGITPEDQVINLRLGSKIF
ncbi:MAG: hypothetical protein EOO15_13065 [Chitinophagaceae bacterium]|nr:MAG: hypothetical protein EOO15_13065 [Chitinophagaceae bacterium]